MNDFVVFLFSQQVNLTTYEDRYEAQHQVVLIITTLIDFEEAWLASQVSIINALKTIWKNDLYKVSCRLKYLNLKITNIWTL